MKALFHEIPVVILVAILLRSFNLLGEAMMKYEGRWVINYQMNSQSQCSARLSCPCQQIYGTNATPANILMLS